jgi:hypothetical protein
MLNAAYGGLPIDESQAHRRFDRYPRRGHDGLPGARPRLTNNTPYGIMI